MADDHKYRFRLRRPGTSLDPAPASKNFTLFMKDIDAPDAVDSGEAITFPLKKPGDGVPLFLELAPKTGCCDQPGYHFYYGYNPQQIQPANFAIIYIVGGCPPFDWTVSQTGYSFAKLQTDERWNRLNADSATAAGDVQVTITDSCGTVITGKVHNVGVLQDVIDSMLDSLFGSLDESYFTGAFNSRIDNFDDTIQMLQTTVTGHTADISNEVTTRSDADAALSSSITTLTAAIDDNYALIQSEETARVNADGAISSNVNTLQTSVDGHTAAIQTLTSSVNGLEAEYLVKLDVNGYISGFGVVGQTDYTEAVFYVDKFKIYNPGETPKPMFAVGVVDGATTVGIDGNLVLDGSITGKQINAQSVIILEDESASNYGKLIVGNNNVVLDSFTNSIRVAPDGGPSGQNYVELINDDINFFFYDGSQHHLYKTLNRIEVGTAQSGVPMTLPGYWREQPSVMITPSTTLIYHGSYPNQSQYLECRVDSIEETSPGSSQYTFTPIMETQLSAGVGYASGTTLSNAIPETRWELYDSGRHLYKTVQGTSLSEAESDRNATDYYGNLALLPNTTAISLNVRHLCDWVEQLSDYDYDGWTHWIEGRNMYRTLTVQAYFSGAWHNIGSATVGRLSWFSVSYNAGVPISSLRIVSAYNRIEETGAVSDIAGLEVAVAYLSRVVEFGTVTCTLSAASVIASGNVLYYAIGR